jgi:hypothetical protein
VLPDRLEEADGAAGPVPSADGRELVLAENVAYLVDDQRRTVLFGPRLKKDLEIYVAYVEV